MKSKSNNQNFRPLLCKSYGLAEKYSDWILNSSIMELTTKNIDIFPSKHHFDNFDHVHFLINENHSDLFNNIDFLQDQASFSIHHRNLNTFSNNYTSISAEFPNKINNFSVHFIEDCAKLIYETSPVALTLLLNHSYIVGMKKPSFSFTPELSLDVLGSNKQKLKWMAKLASLIGQNTPICLVYPGWLPKDIYIYNKLCSNLNPSAVGIYSGSKQNRYYLVKNILTIKKLNPELSLVAIGVWKPNFIKFLNRIGVDHFVITGWGNDRGNFKPLDPVTGKFVSNYPRFQPTCHCYGCSKNLLNYLLEKNVKRNLQNIQISIHNIYAYRKFIDNLIRNKDE